MFKTMMTGAVALGGLMGVSACLSAPAAQLSARDAAANALLRDVMAADGGPGVMASVVKNGVVVWEGSAGLANVEHNLELTPQHRLRIGSVSKPITAMLTLQMATEGLIDIDGAIADHVPELAPLDTTITARHLATHLSGVRHYDFSNFQEANNVYYRHRLNDALSVFINDPLLTPPGEEFHYSSLAYNLLGAALENASGESFGALVRQYVAEPLGLENTVADHPLNVVERRSGFYTVTAANPVFSWMKDGAVINTIFRDSSDYYPSGGMLSSATDLALFVSATFEGRLISGEYEALLIEEARTTTGEPVGYSFGWQIFRDEDGKIITYGHNGETNGAYAAVRYFPEFGLAVAGVTNYNLVAGEPAFFEAVAEGLPKLFLTPE